MWHWIAGAPRVAPPDPDPQLDLDNIAAQLTRRLGVVVTCSMLTERTVQAHILLGAATDAWLPVDKIVNRLERQLVRAASLIRLV